LKPLLETNKVSLKNIAFLQAEDDIFSLGAHFALFAQII
jgi:hypothetical protein